MATAKKIDVARRLRQRETRQETEIWRLLRGRQAIGLKFRRQHPIGPYIVDFACPQVKLAIEIDGYWHTRRIAEDATRTKAIQSAGYDVVRFSVPGDTADLDALVEMIVGSVRERLVARNE
jgi:very-short-patch-repair endonuclease